MNNLEICEALFSAFQDGDEEKVRSLCAPDLQGWQNDNPPMTLDKLVRFSMAVVDVVDNFRYEEAKRSATTTGFVEEHSVRGTLPDGSELDMRICVVADVQNGKVQELREYLDANAASGLIKALS
ncbi:nuclear transport factor 2 family protein [Congregibacter brevis]|uniref:Nuclear transport factor 2 family protein n=1 Tax=Congregibacter brevis TaxID=3081201 RepID=A0ABZ0IC65_9GAMM|nr:nuclear transport factor 2 family protein [Congregibacter sp. IMCC45268]